MKKTKFSMLSTLAILTMSIVLQPIAVFAETPDSESNQMETTRFTTDLREKTDNQIDSSENIEKEHNESSSNMDQQEKSNETGDSYTAKNGDESSSIESQSETVSNPKITYNANGGTNSGTVKNDQIALNGTYTVGAVGTGTGELNFTAPDPKKQIFDGWNTDPNGSGDSYSAGQVVASWPYSEDTILYAQWATASTLSFNLNGAKGNSAPNSQFEKLGTVIKIPEIPSGLTASTANTTISGVWNTKADGTGTDYSPGSNYAFTADNMTLYLKIVANPADAEPILTFNLNGGSTTDSDLTNGIKTNADKSYTLTLPTSTPVRGGYKFNTWKINGSNYAAGSTVQIKYSTVAVAQWGPMQSVNYQQGLPIGSTDSVSNMPSNTRVAADGNWYTVPSNIPTRTSTDGKVYTFSHWRLDNSVDVYPGGRWRTNKSPSSWNFVAIWTSYDPVSQWTVSLNSNGATGGSAPYKYTNVSKGDSILIPGKGSLTKNNSTFVGWSDGTNIYYEGDSYKPTKDTTLVAQWSINGTQGTLKFLTQAKSGSNPAAVTDSSGTTITLPDIPLDNTAPSEGYVFWGWSSNKNASVPDYYAGNKYTLSSGVNTLYGVWTPTLSEYWTQIKVNKNGADGELPSGITSNNVYPLTSASEQYLFVVPEVTRTGYKLVGWTYSKDDKTYQPNDKILLGNLATTKNPGTLTAQWEAINYKISYDKGDATSGSVPDTGTTTVAYNKSYTLLENKGNLSKDGYTFIGWTDGSSIYTPGQNMSPDKDVVFKPAWKKNPSGGGSGTTGTVNIMYVALESGVTGDLPDSVSIKGNYTTSYTVSEPEANFSYPGYSFVGWYLLDSKGKEVDYSPGSTFIVGNDNLIFYAKWKKQAVIPENSYVVSFNGNGNTSGLVPNDLYVGKGKSTTLPNENTLVNKQYKDNNASTGTINTNDYIFVGWSKNKNAHAGDSDVLSKGASITPTTDEVYYAIWDLEAKDITLAYDGNGNTGGTPPSDMIEQRYTEKTIDGSNQGADLTKAIVESGQLVTYVFAGWNTQADGKGKDYFSGSIFNFSQNLKLYAKWIPTESTLKSRIIYLGNGNTSGDYIRYDDTDATSYTIKDNGNMAKNGYIFNGWNTQADGKGNTYNAGDSINTVDHDSLVLYAQWIKSEDGINVIYNGNGNTSGSLPKSFNGPKGSNVTLASSSDVSTLGLKKTGYMFAGWAKNVLGTGTQYVAGQTYPFNENTILYAIWAEDGNYIATPSSITYHPNYVGSAGTYDVKGYVDSTAAVDGSSVLHGHKVVAKEKNGGAYLGEDYSVASYTTTGLSSRSNYAFAGWSTDPKATEPMYSAQQVINLNTTDLNLYAVWTPGTYQIIYDKNASDATESMNNQIVTYDSETSLTLNKYIRPGYTFSGWNTKADGSGTPYTDGQSILNLVETGGSQKLYAQWKVNDYEVAFDKNATEATGTMSNQTFVYDKEQELTANAYARPGYTFSGWNTKADGTGTTYNNKQSVKNLTTKSGDIVTLYAQWKANGYEVAFDKNATEATGSMSNQAFVYDKEQGLTANAYARPGYTFSGWNTKADGTGTTYNDKQSVKNLTTKSGDTVTLYAQWLGNESNNILFDLNAGGDTSAA
ncbi:InlB B-repeat-containing protein, partial [Enterococcus gilvus]